MYFFRFQNNDTLEQFDLPVDIYKTPDAALAYLHKICAIGYADRVQYMGKHYMQYVRL